MAAIWEYCNTRGLCESLENLFVGLGGVFCGVQRF